MDPDRTAHLGSSSDARDSRAGGASGAEDGEALARSFLGKKLGEFRVLREIGRGSMGIVFEAEQEGLKRRVAVKVLPPSLSVTRTVIQRFLREAQSIAKLSHENIVQIYEIGESENVNWYAMQFVEGKSLDRAFKDRKFSPQDCARIVAASARALFYAHENGIIHRDIKPANLILTYKDKPVITDFGLARPEKAATLTESGALVGTPIYMSPEQVRGDRDHIDRRTDIYSLGVTLYEMLTGTIPFEATSTQEILRKIEAEDPRPIRKVAPHVPRALATICHKALEKELERRYQTAIEFALDLERFLAGEAIQARPMGFSTRMLRRARRHKVITSLVAASIVLGGLVVVQTMRSRTQQRENQLGRYQTVLAEGRAAVESGNTADALLKFTEAIALKPDDATFYVERGKAFYKLSRYEEAIRDFTQALTLDPNQARARVWRGTTMCQEGSPEERSRGFEEVMQVLEQNPDNSECLKVAVNLVMSFARNSARAQREELLKSASRWVQHALELNANDDEALVLQGNLYEEDGVYFRDASLIDLAYANYDKAKRINKQNLQALNLLARSKDSLLPKSTKGAGGATTAGNAPSSWLFTLAAEGLTWAKDRVEVPTDLLSKTASLFVPSTGGTNEPSLAGVDLDQLERLLEQANAAWNEEDYARAIALYQNALVMHPNTLEAHHRIAEYCLGAEHEDLPRARASIDKALAAAPSNLRTLMLAFRVYNAQREPERMKEVIELATKFHPALLTVPDVQEFLRAQGIGDASQTPQSPPSTNDGGASGGSKKQT
ncbi:MAG: protein kinase [Planctomycetes bacterium]|nr:protein kinase [Planctomycetota bacterium]MCC7170321.1 protein kinase [Planctomycetota bacterium]